MRRRVACKKEREDINISRECKSRRRKAEERRRRGCEAKEGHHRGSVMLGLHNPHTEADTVRHRGPTSPLLDQKLAEKYL